ncbi:MAG: hypothetical protein KBS95_07165 [Alistipes sp.]|nr:hypothetical protein [Candidatus Alistipes equi]
MKRKICFNAILIFLCLCTINAKAERAVWVIGHAANSNAILKSALSDGANGVEIDVRTKDGKFWNVSHDYNLSPQELEDPKWKNRGYVSLETYLKFPELMNDKFCLLYLDIKHSKVGYIKELVEFVHRVAGVNTPYAIIYAVYYTEELNRLVYDEKKKQMVHLLTWLNENLAPNEGINVGWETPPSNDKEYNANLFVQKAFQPSKHLFTYGYWNSTVITRHWKRVGYLKTAREYRDKGKFCSRVGFWTALKTWDAWWFLDKYASNNGKTDCDMVMVECHNDVVMPPWSKKDALANLIKDYFNPSAKEYQTYNKGKLRLANRNDKFWVMP